MIGQIYCPPNLTSKIGCKKKKKKREKLVVPSTNLVNIFC